MNINASHVADYVDAFTDMLRWRRILPILRLVASKESLRSLMKARRDEGWGSSYLLFSGFGSMDVKECLAYFEEHTRILLPRFKLEIVSCAQPTAHEHLRVFWVVKAVDNFDPSLCGGDPLGESYLKFIK